MANRDLDYTVCIRALTLESPSMHRLIGCIHSQTVLPREIIVCLPTGADSGTSEGLIRTVYADKGMVSQRVASMAEAKSEFLLVTDDDVVFPPSFAAEMHRSMVSAKGGELDCVLAFPTYEPSGNTPPSSTAPRPLLQSLRRFHLAFTGQAFYSHRPSLFFDTIASTGGHRTFLSSEEELCQTGCFQCFFIKRTAASAIGFGEDLWLQEGSLSTYAAFDDAVFFYKAFLGGYRIKYTRTTAFAHLDAKQSRSAASALEQRKIRLFSTARNRTIFWYLYIHRPRHTLHTLCGGMYGILGYAIYNTLANLSPRRLPAIGTLYKGYGEALQYIRSLRSTHDAQR